MDTTLAVVIGGVILALVVFAIVAGRNFSQGRIKLGKHVEGEVKGNVPGPTAVDNKATGKKNKILAEGPGANASRNVVNGDENEIGARTR
jgi:hypothetical protein